MGLSDKNEFGGSSKSKFASEPNENLLKLKDGMVRNGEDEKKRKR